MLNPNIDELNQAISECVSVPNSTIAVKFGFIKLGPKCNASEPNTFTKARCYIDKIRNGENRPYTLDFRTIFNQGIRLLRDYKNESRQLRRGENAAIRKLINFFENKGKI